MGRIGANTELRTTAADFALLDKFTDEDGRGWLYVQADGAISINTISVITEAGQADMLDTTNSATARGDACGVSSAAFADNEYGWLCVYGTGTDILQTVLASAAANVPLNSTATAGSLDDDGTSGAETVDGLVIITTDGGSGSAIQAELTWPTVGATIA